MNPGSEEDIFAAAIALPPDRRRDFVIRACAGDDTFRRRIEALLAAGDDRANLLATATGDPAPAFDGMEPGSNDELGRWLGRYRILERIGEGGCGLVFLAEQSKPIRRKVAIKVIKPGMDTAGVVARFEAERQALAMMDHPGIAKILDAGVVGPASQGHSKTIEVAPAQSTGRPFFVMEHVRGIRITDFCRLERPPLRDQLELFIKVCNAIQHAHQKGIIHRDIKPSNILVTHQDGVPVPKVIDFGIAKATEGRLTEASLHTLASQLVGTPAYMSPEQASTNNADVDTRSDIYSLGVVLYEMLTGSTPFRSEDLLSGGIDGMCRAIREVEPDRPSVRVRSPQRRPGTAPIATVGMEVPADLDWIVMRCLEKDRARRYGTAAELGADLRRHLENEPVTARPPSTLYRFQKAWARNRVFFSIGTTVALLLVAGVLATTWQAARARRSEVDQTELRKQAEASHAQETLAHRRAEEDGVLARQNLYASQLKLAFQTYTEATVDRPQEILASTEPGFRGFEWRLLWNLATEKPPLAVDAAAGASMCLAPNGSLMATGAPDGQLDLWNLAAGTRVRLPNRHSPHLRIWTLAFSRDARTLATATGGLFAPNHPAEIFLWDVASKSYLTNLAGHAGAIAAIALSQDARWVAAADDNDTVTLWDRSSGITRQLDPHSPGEILSVDFSPDQRWLASTHKGQGVRIWEVASGALLHTLPVSGQEANCARFSPDGQSLAVAFESGLALVYDTARWITRLTLVHNQDILCLNFSPDGRRLVCGGMELGVWDAETGDRLGVFRGGGEVWSVALHPDGRRVFSSSFFDPPKVWDLDAPRRDRTFQASTNGVRALALSRSGHRLATASGNLATPYHRGEIRVWSLDTPSTPKSLLTLPGHEADATRLVFTPDEKRLISCGMDRTIRMWDIETAVEKQVIRGDFPELTGLALSPDGRMLVAAPVSYKSAMPKFSTGRAALAGISGEVGCWELDGNILRRLPSFDLGSVPVSVAYSPNGNWLAAGSIDGRIRIWDVKTRQLVHQLQSSGETLSLEFSHDNTRLAAGTTRFLVEVWDLRDPGRLHFKMTGHSSVVLSLGFSPDDRTLVSGGADFQLIFWNPQRGLNLGSLKVHRENIFGLGLTPDGNTLVSSSLDGEVRFWDASPGTEPKPTARSPEERRP